MRGVFGMYDQKLKDEILHLLKEKTIKEVSTQFNISTTTLYRWQKIKEDSKLIKKLISEERYDEALEITKKYSNNIQIQSQLMTIYTKKGEYEKAIENSAKVSGLCTNSKSINNYLYQKRRIQKINRNSATISN